MMFFKSSLD